MMKKWTLVFFTMLIFIPAALSQTAKGRVQTGGQFSLEALIFSDFFNMNITPRITSGYFLTDHLVVRGEAVGNIRLNEFNAGNFDWRAGIGLGLRNYFGSQRFQPFLGANILFRKIDEGISNGGKFTELNYTAELGCSFFITDNVAIELAAPVTYQTVRQNPQIGAIVQPDVWRWKSDTMIGFQFYIR